MNDCNCGAQNRSDHRPHTSDCAVHGIRPLTAYVVIYDDGDRRPTNMAAGVTLADAKKYFVGKQFEITDNTFHTAVEVEEITY